MKCIFFAVLAVFLLISISTQAQILNVNKLDVTTDSSRYTFGGIEFFFETDNRSPTPEESAKLLTIESAVDIVYVSDLHAYYLAGELNYYEATGDPVISTGFIHYRTNLMRKNRLSYEVYTQASFDASRRLDFRGIVGGGIKYRIYKTPEFEMDFGTGAFYEHEKWETFDEISQIVSVSFWKSSSYLKSNLELSDAANLSFITFYQVGYDWDIDAFRHRISGELQLNFNITSHFSFVVEGSIHYEDKPIIDINKTVYGIKNGLAYTF
ncbi:DUF481 domain-containing protein [Reichenbachiella agarivorans]|uniref:DUF481 domain-containing protein n=1 Tax=Reichenbachiella agarivorans TaxID=2979464 RepID=A0ABY6CM69_9BACT|nr:DUF481 domain-containing protein [Reichenbachiella agarivorans]UXP31474.1 DUF481 domain-containing protein [Reichenbachiella agarivorans]